MTDLSPVKTHAELQPGSSALFATPTQPISNGYSPAEDNNFDDEAIKCICGYNEDDGNTVLCEICHTWGHIECYYPDGVVPDVHECVDCKPRAIDVEGAKERQRLSRMATSSSERKTKRAPAKNNKKRTKDAIGQTNGWPASDHYYATDRTSGSPRDQPPPSKRPKTTHRTSSSISRKRAGSTMAAHSPTKALRSPARFYSGEYFSSEYMALREKPDFTPIHANIFSTIAVSNDLSSWLNDPERLQEVTGKTAHDIFQRWDRAYEELERTSPGVTKHTEEDPSIVIRDRHPVITRLTLNSHAPAGAYIGELKGSIGRKEEYQQDPANRWDELRHPEPFVFFHDSLPVYIDSRVEGTLLRYVRRSCNPNVKIQIIINNGEYHFCLISTEDIQAGQEIALGWTLDQRFYKTMAAMSRGNIDEDDGAYVVNWTSCVLANLGGCACGRAPCALSRFDAREHPNSTAANGHGLKPPKPRKSKKTGNQISPLSTGRATNSRAASEAINATDVDDDNADARSSSRSKPTSRDITPMTATNDGTGLGVEMSDRERRKLMQEERLFEQLKNAEHATKKGKKRNSAGSNLNTPNMSTSVSSLTLAMHPKNPQTFTDKTQRQLGYSEFGVSSPLASGAVNKSRLNGLTMLAGSRSSLLNSNSVVQSQRRTKPVYVNASTQTEKEKEEPPSALTLLRRQRGSNLLLLTLKKRQAERKRHPLSAEEKANMTSRQTSRVSSPVLGKDPATLAKEASAAMPPPPVPASPDANRTEPSLSTSSPPPSGTEEKNDVEMKDVDDGTSMEPSGPNVVTGFSSTALDTSLPQTNGAVQSAASSWSSAALPTPMKSPTSTSKTHDLHVQLPPAPTFSTQTQTPTTPSVDTPTPGSISGNPMTESPSSGITVNVPIFSPSVTTSVAPSPMKKKLSLSDYTNRKKRNEALAQQAQQQAAPSNLSQPPTTAASADEKQKENIAGMEKPSLPPESSSVLEVVDMPLPPPKSEQTETATTASDTKESS